VCERGVAVRVCVETNVGVCTRVKVGRGVRKVWHMCDGVWQVCTYTSCGWIRSCFEGSDQNTRACVHVYMWCLCCHQPTPTWTNPLLESGSSFNSSSKANSSARQHATNQPRVITVPYFSQSTQWACSPCHISLNPSMGMLTHTRSLCSPNSTCAIRCHKR
jgi:hypothetical protein